MHQRRIDRIGYLHGPQQEWICPSTRVRHVPVHRRGLLCNPHYVLCVQIALAALLVGALRCVVPKRVQGSLNRQVIALLEEGQVVRRVRLVQCLKDRLGLAGQAGIGAYLVQLVQKRNCDSTVGCGRLLSLCRFRRGS